MIKAGLGSHSGDFAASVAAAQSKHFALEKKRLREEIEQATLEMEADGDVHHRMKREIEAFW